MTELSQCLKDEASKRLADFYSNNKSKNSIGVSGGYVSGGTAATGGLTSVEDYANSVYSQAKETLIRNIAKDMNNILGIKGPKQFNASDDISKIVSQMNELLPNPRKKRGIRSNKNGETKYTAIHKELCTALAKSINDNYGATIIDFEQGENALCNSVSAIILKC